MKETQNIEWKRAWRDEYLKWICGFANAEGGELVVGRNDKGVVVGVENAERLMEEIPNKVRDILGIMVDVNLRQENSQELLEIRVEPYPSPVNYKGEYFYRSGRTNQMLKGAALDRFLLRKHGRTWDGSPLPGLKPADLDAEALKTFRRLALRSQRLPETVLEEPDRALLEKLHLVEGRYLTHAAALMFHGEPERFITGAYVKIGYFESNADLRYQDEVQGDLISQVNRTLEVLRAKYLRAWITYEGLQRIETWPMPMPALREAVLNAVAHKDYAGGVPIQIRVYPDKLMIWNPGELPPDWTIEKLLGEHASIPFNPDVANVFFRSGMIEAWGRGIERIMEACLEAGTPEPEVRHETSGLWVSFHFLPEHQAVGDATKAKVMGRTQLETLGPTQEIQETTQETTQETQGTTQERILALLKAYPTITRRRLADRIGITSDGIKYHLDKLRSSGSIRHVGPTKTGRWEVLK